MILVLSTCYQPFRAVLLGEDGTVKMVLRPSTDCPNIDGFYAFPQDEMLGCFLRENFNPYDIKLVVIFGKPLFHFETLLKELLVPPSIRKMAFFGRRVNGYFNTAFRLRKNLSDLLRFTPNCWFLSALGSFASIKNVIALDGDILFWGVQSEYSRPFLIRKDSREIVILNHLNKNYMRYSESKKSEIRRQILEATLSSIDMEKGYVVVNHQDSNDDFQLKNIRLISDTPTMAILGLCHMFLSSDDKAAAERQANFKRSLLELAGMLANEGKMPYTLSLGDLEKLWAESPSFKTLAEHADNIANSRSVL